MSEVRLIDANALIGFLHNQTFIDGDDRSLVYRWIEEQLTIEPEVQHGRWIFESSKTSSWMKCSVCCKAQNGQTATFSCCPNCGAKMNMIDTNVDNKGSTNNDSFKNGG